MLPIVNFLLFLLVFIPAITKFSRRHSFTLSTFCIMYSLLFSFVPSMHMTINGLYVSHPESVYGPISDPFYFYIYSVLNLLFSLIVFLVILFGKSRINVNFVKNAIYFRSEYLFLIALVFFTGFLICFYSTGFYSGNILSIHNGIVDGGRMSWFRNAGYNSFLMNLSFYLMSVCCFFSFLDLVTGFKNKVVSFVVYCGVILITVYLGNRQFLMLMLSGWVFGYFVSERFSFKKIVVTSILFLLFLISWQVFRRGFLQGGSVKISDFYEVLLRGDLPYFYISSMEAIRFSINEGKYFIANFYSNIAFILIPSDFTYGLKQKDLSYLFSVAYTGWDDTRTGNYPPGYIGMMYLNFGSFGAFILGLPIVVFLRSMELSKFEFLRLIFSATSIFIFLQLLRGTLLGIYQFVGQTLICISIYYFIKLFIRRN